MTLVVIAMTYFVVLSIFFLVMIPLMNKDFDHEIIIECSMLNWAPHPNIIKYLYDFCRDTIFNNPRMTLGSYVKGPNNMICREVGLKGKALVVSQRFSRGFRWGFYMVGFGLIG